MSKSLDREEISAYHLKVSATDGLFVSEINVRIDLLDANDNSPICAQVPLLFTPKSPYVIKFQYVIAIESLLRSCLSYLWFQHSLYDISLDQ